MKFKLLKETREEAERMTNEIIDGEQRIGFLSSKNKVCPRCGKHVKEDEHQGNKCVYCMNDLEWEEYWKTH